MIYLCMPRLLMLNYQIANLELNKKGAILYDLIGTASAFRILCLDIVTPLPVAITME